MKVNKDHIIGGLAVGVLCIGIVKLSSNTHNNGIMNSLITWKSPVDNSVTEIIKQYPQRGNPGDMMVWNETGEIFTSKNQLCKVLEISRNELLKHLRGNRKDIRGMTFTCLGEYDVVKLTDAIIEGKQK